MGKAPYLINAVTAEFDVRLLTLLCGKVGIPGLPLIEPHVSLQIEPDGRQTWALSRDTSDLSATPNIGSLSVDKGVVKYLSSAQGADIVALFSIAAAL